MSSVSQSPFSIDSFNSSLRDNQLANHPELLRIVQAVFQEFEASNSTVPLVRIICSHEDSVLVHEDTLALISDCFFRFYPIENGVSKLPNTPAHHSILSYLRGENLRPSSGNPFDILFLAQMLRMNSLEKILSGQISIEVFRSGNHEVIDSYFERILEASDRFILMSFLMMIYAKQMLKDPDLLLPLLERLLLKVQEFGRQDIHFILLAFKNSINKNNLNPSIDKILNS